MTHSIFRGDAISIDGPLLPEPDRRRKIGTLQNT